MEKDISKNLNVAFLIAAAISTNTTTAGAIIDTADLDTGLFVAMALTAFTDGTYTMLIQESDASDMSGATTIDSSQLVGSLPALSAVDTAGVNMDKVGILYTKRYVRVSIVSTGVTTGATALVTAVSKAELRPAA